ncbi:MAG: hypothetical protein KF816_11540 [Melioribacteraceae bacterium]|jgi:hypothetical protein|nr:hypothetical protein [Melioribacteraceae bacterium]
MDIEISNHVCKRFIERFNPQLETVTNYNDRLRLAKNAINAILKDASYKSDDTRGILLISETFKAKLIVKNKTVITITPLGKKNRTNED